MSDKVTLKWRYCSLTQRNVREAWSLSGFERSWGGGRVRDYGKEWGFAFERFSSLSYGAEKKGQRAWGWSKERASKGSLSSAYLNLLRL